MEHLKVGIFQAVVVRHDDHDHVYIIDTRNGDQYHKSPVDGKMCRCNKIDNWQREGGRESMDNDQRDYDF